MRAFDRHWGRSLHSEFRNSEFQGKPSIYQWHIEGAGRYIGKFDHRRRLRAYSNNTDRLLLGLNYRPKTEDFRLVHKALAQAVADGRRIVLEILENPGLDKLGARENCMIAQFGCLNDERQRTDIQRCDCGRFPSGMPCLTTPLPPLWTKGEVFKRPLPTPP